ncbi:MAG: hypothetical protein ACKOW0_00740 [Schleiferiaceae bacterium]
MEEIAEQLETLAGDTPETKDLVVRALIAVQVLATALKDGRARVTVHDRKNFLDAVADQIVTGVGAGYCAGMNTTEALRRVNTSNWSKYSLDGEPIFDKAGKIIKGPRYEPPDLSGLY